MGSASTRDSDYRLVANELNETGPYSTIEKKNEVGSGFHKKHLDDAISDGPSSAPRAGRSPAWCVEPALNFRDVDHTVSKLYDNNTADCDQECPLRGPLWSGGKQVISLLTSILT